MNTIHLHPYTQPADSTSHEESISRKQKLLRIKKRNEKLDRHIQKLLDFITSTNIGEYSMKQECIKELSPGRFIININDIKHHDKDLEELKVKVLAELSVWNKFSFTHKRIIKLLEEYKYLTKSLIDRETDPYTRLFNDLRILRDQSKILPHPYTSQTQEVSNKEYIKSLGGKQSPWTRFEYFAQIPQSITRNLQATTNESVECKEMELLSLYAVNRLAAIAKMLNYCEEFRINIEQFKNGRMKQKLAALRSQRKLIPDENSTPNSKSVHIETGYYPTSEELDYLLGLDTSRLDNVMSELKASVQYSITENARETEMKKLLNWYLDRNKALKLKLLQRISTDKVPRNTSKDKDLLSLFNKLTPIMVKKRERRLRGEQKLLKKMKLKEDQGQSATRSEDYSVQLLNTKEPKVVFRIIKA